MPFRASLVEKRAQAFLAFGRDAPRGQRFRGGTSDGRGGSSGNLAQQRFDRGNSLGCRGEDVAHVLRDARVELGQRGGRVDEPDRLGTIRAEAAAREKQLARGGQADRKSTRLNSSHSQISYAVFCLKKKKKSHADWLASIVKESG